METRLECAAAGVCVRLGRYSPVLGCSLPLALVTSSSPLLPLYAYIHQPASIVYKLRSELLRRYSATAAAIDISLCLFIQPLTSSATGGEDRHVEHRRARAIRTGRTVSERTRKALVHFWLPREQRATQGAAAARTLSESERERASSTGATQPDCTRAPLSRTPSRAAAAAAVHHSPRLARSFIPSPPMPWRRLRVPLSLSYSFPTRFVLFL